MKPAWVPLPAPGGPRRISLTKALWNLPFMTRAVKQRPCAFQVLGRVNAGERCVLSHCDGDRVAVPKRPQLLERFESFKLRAFEPRIGTQEIGAIGIDADMSVARKPLRQGPCGMPERIPGPGHCRRGSLRPDGRTVLPLPRCRGGRWPRIRRARRFLAPDRRLARPWACLQYRRAPFRETGWMRIAPG